MNYSDMLHNEHFLTFSGILRRFHANEWPTAPVGNQYARLLKLKGSAAGWPQMDEFLGEFLDFLVRLVEANGLTPLYSTEDLDWLMELFTVNSMEESDQVRAVISLMFAVGTMSD